MAITRTTISRTAGWTNSQVITQLEEGLAFAGLHGGALTGLAAGPGYISDPANFGGTVGTVTDTYRDIEPTATSGAGTGATFNVTRTSGKVNFIRVNRPGSGYVDGDTVTISGDSIGGAANGATQITFPIFVASTVTGANTYDFSYTGDFVLSGTDSLGSFSNIARTTPQTITVMEGDTISITLSNSSSRRLYFLLEDGFFGESGIRPLSPMSTDNEGLYGSSSSPLTVTWQTKKGQAGTYYISSGSSGEGTIAHDIVILPDDGSRTFTPLSYGSSTTFFDKQSEVGATFPWGCLRQEVQAGKKYGSTYRTFQVSNTGRLEFAVGSSFSPDLQTFNSSDRRFKGSRYLDLSDYLDTNSTISFSSTFLRSYNISTPPIQSSGSSGRPFFGQAGGFNDSWGLEDFCSSNAGNAFSLDLNVYRSSLDPSFAVFSYKQPNLSSTNIKSNSFLTFFLHNFTNSIWDLDNVFLGGLTLIWSNGGNTTQPELWFRTYCSGSIAFLSTYPSVRGAEFGYLPMGTGTGTSLGSIYSIGSDLSKDSVYRAISHPNRTNDGDSSRREVGIYYRTNTTIDPTQGRGIGMPDASNFNAIIKGIPLNTTLVPVPYYLPDDFVLVMFDNATPSLNVQQGDTLVVEEGVEEYVIITGSYNQTGRTRGILFCARIV
jgi:hypothetical protein